MVSVAVQRKPLRALAQVRYISNVTAVEPGAVKVPQQDMQQARGRGRKRRSGGGGDAATCGRSTGRSGRNGA